jgi:exonuclease III
LCLSETMSCIAWNCRGLGNLRTVSAFKKLLRDKNPTCVFLSETKKKDFEMNKFRNVQGLSGVVAVSCSGEGNRRVGGLAMFWKEGVEVEVLSLSSNHIDILIAIENGDEKWRLTGVYGFPESQMKHKTCELIDQLSLVESTDKWLLMGDFNLILSQDEKEGGNFGSSHMISMFRDTLQNHNLSDLGFEGDKLTWHNRQDGVSNIKAHLDRMVATPAWSSFYPSASVVHLTRYASDHLPLWLRLASRKPKKKQNVLKLQRFEECWLRDSGILEVVKGSWEVEGDSMSDKINRCVNDLSNWSKDRFGDVPNQIKIVQKKLDDLNKQTQHEGVMSEIRRVEAKLNDLVESEEIWWAQRSRALCG